MTIRTREDVLAALNCFERRVNKMPVLADRLVTLLVNIYANRDKDDNASLERALLRVNGEVSNLLRY